MSSIMAVARASRVALLAEGVDRNLLEQGLRHKARVALREEGVDRNPYHCETLLGEKVALLAEGVDRNHEGGVCVLVEDGRPPRGGRG